VCFLRYRSTSKGVHTTLATNESSWAEYESNAPVAAHLPLWRECFSAIEAVLLHLAPVYYGAGVPAGDGSGVIVIPGFLLTDTYLSPFRGWLRRINYRPYVSEIGRNTECPDLIIRDRLNATIDRARSETGRKVHLIGHSLGGIIAIAAAGHRPADIASVITLGSPLTGNAAHPAIMRAAESVRTSIRNRRPDSVHGACYTCDCSCPFVSAVKQRPPDSVGMTAIYSRTDSVVDWRYCITQNPLLDVEVPGTHVGMVLNPSVYTVIAGRLAAARANADSAQSS
jgi:triacylglycerol lipase